MPQKIPTPSPLKENNGPSPYDVNNTTSCCAICFSLGSTGEPLNFD